MTRRTLPVALAIAALAAGAAALAIFVARPARPAAPPGSMVLRTAISEPSSLDPARASTASDYAVVTRVFSRLVECDAALDLRPSLARTWTVSPDGRTYTFLLAPARFHNGREVEARDVAGTLTRLLAADTGGSYPEMLSVVTGARERRLGQAKDVAGVRVLGPREIAIRLDEPYAPFLSLLSAPALSIVPAEEAERAGAAFGRAPLGSGPFRFERWEAGDSITLQAHDGAPEGRPPVDALSFVLHAADVGRAGAGAPVAGRHRLRAGAAGTAAARRRLRGAQPLRARGLLLRVQRRRRARDRLAAAPRVPPGHRPGRVRAGDADRPVDGDGLDHPERVSPDEAAGARARPRGGARALPRSSRSRAGARACGSTTPRAGRSCRTRSRRSARTSRRSASTSSSTGWRASTSCGRCRTRGSSRRGSAARRPTTRIRTGSCAGSSTRASAARTGSASTRS